MQEFEHQELTDQETGSGSSSTYDDDSPSIDGRAAKRAALEHNPGAAVEPGEVPLEVPIVCGVTPGATDEIHG